MKIDFSTGTIKIGKCTITKDSTCDELMENLGEGASLIESETGINLLEVPFENNVDLVCVDYIIFTPEKKVDQVVISPNPTKDYDYEGYKVTDVPALCREWLKANVPVHPSEESKNTIEYKFDWGSMICSIPDFYPFLYKPLGFTIKY